MDGRHSQLLPAAQWLKLLLAHIPDQYEHRVRYYGGYSNRARGERCASANPQTDATTLPRDETPLDRSTRTPWARLLHQVYEVDPLECPRCGSTLRLNAVIDEPAVISRIPNHLRRWDPKPKDPDHPGRDPPWPAHTTLPLTYQPVPNSA